MAARTRERAQSFIQDAKDGGAKGKEEESLQRCMVFARLRPTKAGDIDKKEGTYKLVHMNKKIIRLGAEDDECAKQYNFDGTFNPECTQEEVFQIVAKPSIEHVLKGYTAAIMAYGQTGTGKSFTMSNMKPGQEGVIPRSAGYLFDLIEQDTKSKYTLSAHFVQIYRDTLSDLMTEESTTKTDIHYTPQSGVEITNAAKTPITNKQDFLDMYQTGDVRRVVRATKMNPESSRGHTALVLYVCVEPTDPDNMNCATKGKITFIDLAGYERFEKTGLKDPIHKDEAKKINASLLSLGTVVTALSENLSHIPWRNSKLTRLLQDSIGGKSRSTIMITVGPSSSHNHETTNSLDFGNRAMAVKVSAGLKQETDFKKLAAKLQELLDEKEEKISKLEVAAKVREAERAERDRRQKMDLARLRGRHQEELTNIMNNGATPEAIQALLKQHEVEDENMEEMQVGERELDEERHEEEERELVAEIEAEHRVRAQSMKREGFESKQKELDAAYALIAQLRGASGGDTDNIAKEIAELAGVNPEDAAAAASPKTVTSAEVGILRREADQLRLECETEKQNAEEKVEKAKNALKKCAGLLKEEREKNKRLSEESVKAEELEKLQGEIEEMKNSKQLVTEHRDELQEKLEKSRNSQSKLMMDKKEVVKQKEELESNYKQQLVDSTLKQTVLDQTLTDINSQIEDLQKQIQTLTAQLEEANAAKEGLEKTITDKESELTISVAALEEALSKLTANESSLTEEQESRRKRERELEKAVEQCRDETRDIEKSLQKEIEDIQISCSGETQTLKDKLEDLRKSLEGTETEKGELGIAVVQLRSALEESNSNLAEGEKRVRELVEELDSEKATVTDLSSKLHQQRENTIVTQKAAAEKQEENVAQVLGITLELGIKTKTISDLEDKLKILEDDLNEEIERLRKKNSQLEEDCSLQNKDSTAAFDELKLQRDSDREAHDSQLQQLKSEQTAKIKSIEESCSEQVTELQRQLSEVEEQLKVSQESITSASELQITTSQQLTELTESSAATLAASEEQQSSLKDQIEQLESQLSQQKDETQKELNDATEQQDTIKQQVTEVEQKLSESEEQYATLKSEYSQLESRLDEQAASAADERGQLDESIQAHQQRESELEETIKNHKTNEEQLTSKIETLEGQLAEQQVESIAKSGLLEISIADVESKNTELEKNISELTLQTDQLTASNEELQGKISELEASSIELSSQLEAANHNNADAEERATKASEATNETTAELAAAAESIAQLTEDRDKLLAEAQEQTTLLSSTDAELTAITEARDAASKQAEESTAKIEALQTEMEDLKDDKNKQIESLETKVTSSLDTNTSLTKLLEEQTSKIAKKKKKLKSKIESLEDELKDGGSENSVLVLKISAMENTISGLEKTVENEKSSSAELTDKITSLENKLEENSTSAGIATASSAAAIAILEEKLSEQQSASDKNIAGHDEEKLNLTTQITTLDSNIIALTAQSEELQTKLDESIAAAGVQQQTLEDNITSLQTQLSTAEEQITTLSTQLEESKATATQQQGSLESQLSQDKESFISQQEELQAKLTDLQSKLDATNSEAADQKEAAGCESESLNTKINELTSALEVASTAATDQKTEYETLKNSLESNIAQLEADATTAAATSADQQTAFESEKDSLGAKISDLEAQLEALDNDASQQKELLEKQCADAAAAHGQEKETLDATVADLETKLATLQTDSEQQQKDSLEKQGAEADTYAQERGTLESKITDLETQLSESSTAALQQKEELEQQIAAGNTERDTLESTISDLRNQIEVSNGDASQQQATSEQEREELNSKVADLEGQLEESATAAANEKNALEQQLTDATAAADNEKAELEKQLDEAISKLESEKQILADSNAELEEKIVASQVESTSVQQDLQSKNETLESDLTDLQKQLDTAIEKAAADISSLTAKEAELQEQLEDQQSDFQTEKLILEEEVETLTEDKEEALAEAERMKKDSEEDMEKIIAAHSEEIEKNETAANEYAALLEARVSELEDKLKELQGDLSDEKSKAELDLLELKKKKDEERDSERQRLNDEKAELEEKVKARGKYKYKSSLISQLITCGQLAVPSSAPRLAPPSDILASLNPEHVKQAVRYRLIIAGHQHTGKSSVYKCLSHEGSVGILSKKAPDVVSPTTTMQCTEHTVREKGKGFLSKKSSLTTHFQVWDTPSDLKVMTALPEGVLPITGCAYVLTYYLTREFRSESQRMEEVLYSILTNTRTKLEKAKMKLPILLIGTRKDMLPSKDSSVLMGKINEARRWFNDNPVAKDYFSLVGVYASSCKDWSIYSDTGKNGITTFGGIMTYVAEEIRRIYPNTPPALLDEKVHGADADLGEWLTGNKSVTSDSQRMALSIHKALLSSIMSIDIMKRRGAWLLGNQEFRGIIQDNIPDHVLEEKPDLVNTFISVFEARGFILHIRDTEFDDIQESCYVIKVGILIDFITSLMLPTLYLQLVPSYANDKPGYLKTSMLKSSGFNIEEVWRPDWELIFDGHLTGTSTSSLLKNSLAFRNDPMLGNSLLECLHCGFRMKTTKEERITFVTGVAIRSLVPELESIFIALFDKHNTGWTGATAKIDSISQQDIVKVQKKIFSEQDQCLLWNDAVAFNRGDAWTFIRMRGNSIIVCTGKSDPGMFSDMKTVIQEIFSIATFKDGMKLDHLPTLSPAHQDGIKESSSISDYMNGLDKDEIRGISFPSDSLDRDSGRRRPPVSVHRDSNGSGTPAGGKIAADRMAMFQ